MAAIALDGVTKVFGNGVVAVDRLSLDVAPGEFFVMLGPTGCGKSTVLRMVAGLDRPTSGRVLIDGEHAARIPPRERGVGMVFQEYALHPGLTVAENIAQPLRAAHATQQEVTVRVAMIAEKLGIADLLRRSPAALSGGQRQRTAMARAVLRDPRVFLLDEPLSNLDAGVRAELRSVISNLARGMGVTTVYVTHDQVEAMTMADRVAVLRRGVLQQIGTPHDVYEDPANLFVAAFLGVPRINLIQAAVHCGHDGGAVVDFGTQTLTVPAGDPLSTALAGHHNERVTVGLRPDMLHPTHPAAAAALRGQVRLVEHLGHEAILHVDSASVPAIPESVGLDLPSSHLSDVVGAELPPAGPLLDRLIPRQRRAPAAPGLRYGLTPSYRGGESVDHDGELLVRVPADGAPRVGEAVTLGVDLHRMLFFDRSGRRIRLI